MRLRFVSAALAVVGVMRAQSRPTRPDFTEFEVASIKPTAPDVTGRWIRMATAHEFAAKNHAFKTLAAAAFNVSPHAIYGGPSWVDSDRYDIVAKAPGEVRPNLNEQMAMLRRLLIDRFHFRFHREEKVMRMFALTVAKGGPKLRESTTSLDATAEGPPPLIFVVLPKSIRLPARNATMREFAWVLQRAALDDPVADQTGLSARYDFDLEFTPDETVFGGDLGKGTDDSTSPGLFAALQQQLGLKLEHTTGSVEALVIDHVERPTEN